MRQLRPRQFDTSWGEPLSGTNYWGTLGSPKSRTIAHACYLEHRFLGSFRVDHPGVDLFDQHKRVSGTDSQNLLDR
jgi:hypothetical protein